MTPARADAPFRPPADEPAPEPPVESGGPSTLSMDADREELLEQARRRRPRRLSHREWIGEGLAGGGFLVAAAAMAVLLPTSSSLDLPTAIALTLAYAVATRIQFEISAGYTDPTQLLFVPMLFIIPTPMVPLFVAAGNLLGQLPDFVKRERHPERSIISLGDSWYAVGPALVIVLAGAQVADISAWPVYVAALAAQFAFDLVANTLREWYELGVPPRMQLADHQWIWTVDGLLSPIGFLAVLAAPQHEYIFLLLLPLVALLAVFASEHRGRLAGALELSQAYRGTTTLLAEVIEHDDGYTGSHSRGVVALSTQVAEQLALNPRQRRNVEFAALLHDVGKLGVPNEIINKAGPLSDEEWALMKLHTVTGERMLNEIGGLFEDVGGIVRSSHERWDGRGYPDALEGEAIPLEARIISCCDAFNAMTTDRSYRPALSLAEAKQELRTNAGQQFDPRVARTVLEIVESEPLPESSRTHRFDPMGPLASGAAA